MRKPPVTSLSSAQRPVSSSASSQRASCAGSSALPSVESGCRRHRRASARRAFCRGRDARRGCRRRPHQRDGLGEVADIVVGKLEQHRVGALGDQRADHARLGVLKRQRAGERRQRLAAFRVRRACGNNPSSAAACCCARAHRRGGRAIRRSGSCILAAPLGCGSVIYHRSRPRRHSRRYRAAAPAIRASGTNAPAHLPARA